MSQVLRLPSSRWVRVLLARLIQQNADHINARMADVDLSSSNRPMAPELQLISHSYKRSNNLSNKDLPSFQIEDITQTGSWIGGNVMGNYHFEFRIWGLLLWEEPLEAQDLISEFAAGVGDVLNQRHVPIPIANGYSMWWNGVMPVTSIDYGAMEFQNGICNGFSAKYQCDVECSIPDSGSQSLIPLT